MAPAGDPLQPLDSPAGFPLQQFCSVSPGVSSFAGEGSSEGPADNIPLLFLRHMRATIA